MQVWATESVWNHLPALIAPDFLQRACARQPEITEAVEEMMTERMPGWGREQEEGGSKSGIVGSVSH